MAWEYMVHTLDAQEAFSSGEIRPRELQNVLNRHGKEGWELVSAFETESGRVGNLVVLTFKRRTDSEDATPARRR
jgi:hypothetical protein